MSRAVTGLALCGALFAAPASAAELRLEIADGYVTLVAADTPLRQILAEWARVGGTRIVNAERVAGPPVTIQLQRVPEQQALAVLLRSVAGYLAAPRRAGSPGASAYESVMILPTSTPPATPPPAAAAARGPASPIGRAIPSQVEMQQLQLQQQRQLMPDGDDQIASEGFITVGSAPTSRQTPAAGAGADAAPAGPAGSPFPQTPQVPVAGARTPTTQPTARNRPGFQPGPTTVPTGFPQPVPTPNGMQRPPGPTTTIQPGVILPNDATRTQTNPDAGP